LGALACPAFHAGAIVTSIIVHIQRKYDVILHVTVHFHLMSTVNGVSLDIMKVTAKSSKRNITVIIGWTFVTINLAGIVLRKLTEL
jgi:hypothetical protein